MAALHNVIIVIIITIPMQADLAGNQRRAKLLSGDSFEAPLIDAKSIPGLLPPGFPAGMSTLQGFRRFLADALAAETAGEAAVEADQALSPTDAAVTDDLVDITDRGRAPLTCRSWQQGRECFTVDIALTFGSGDYTLRLPVIVVRARLLPSSRLLESPTACSERM